MKREPPRRQVQEGDAPTQATGGDRAGTRAVVVKSEGWRHEQMDQTQKGTATEALFPSMASPASQACTHLPAVLAPVAVGV